jgi:hypothetical protein
MKRRLQIRILLLPLPLRTLPLRTLPLRTTNTKNKRHLSSTEQAPSLVDSVPDKAAMKGLTEDYAGEHTFEGLPFCAAMSTISNKLLPVAFSKHITIRNDTKSLTQADPSLLANLVGTYVPMEARNVLVRLHKGEILSKRDYSDLQLVTQLSDRHQKGVYGSY